MVTAQSTEVARTILTDFIQDRRFMRRDLLEDLLNTSYQSIQSEELSKWVRKTARAIIKDQGRRGHRREYGTIPELALYLDRCFVEKEKAYQIG